VSVQPDLQLAGFERRTETDTLQCIAAFAAPTFSLPGARVRAQHGDSRRYDGLVIGAADGIDY